MQHNLITSPAWRFLGVCIHLKKMHKCYVSIGLLVVYVTLALSPRVFIVLNILKSLFDLFLFRCKHYCTIE